MFGDVCTIIIVIACFEGTSDSTDALLAVGKAKCNPILKIHLLASCTVNLKLQLVAGLALILAKSQPGSV